MFKWIAIAFLVVILAVTGAVFYLFSSLDGWVEAAIEDHGSRATGAPVSVESVEISLSKGEGSIRGTVVGNPEGFEGPIALDIGKVHVVIDKSTIRERPLVIKEVTIDSLSVSYEPRPGGGNLETIKRNVDRYVQGLGKGGSADPSAEEEVPRVLIEHLYIRQGTLQLRLPVLGISRTLSLPEIHLEDIGKKGSGATPGEVTQKIWGALMQRSLGTIRSSSFKGVLEGSQGGKSLDDALEELKKIFRN